jgi:hypothetical protein
MKEKISRICLIVYVILFILSAFLASAAGGSVVWFCVMGVLAIPPIAAGPKWHRILGTIALLIAIALAVSDYNAGKHRRESFLKRLNDTQKQQEEKNRSSQ